MSMLENLKKLEDSGKVGGGDYFKVQNGNNIRESSVRQQGQSFYLIPKYFAIALKCGP